LFALAGINGLMQAGPATAQSRRDRNENYADRIRRETEIAAQKMEDEVATALAEARKLAAKDAVKAANRLKKILSVLENDDVLTASRRKQLIGTVKQKIDFYTKDAESKARDLAASKDNKDRLKGQRIGEDKERRDRVDSVRKSIQDTRDAITEGKRLAKERETGTRRTMEEIERSSIPIVEDVKFPRDWKKRLALRKPADISKKEAAILRILNSTISVDFKDNKLEDIISYLQDKTGQTIFLDKDALKDAMVEYETPITLKANKVSVRALLRKILNDLNLTYIIKDEIIQVTSYEKARKSMVVRAYPVADLVTSNVDSRLPPGAQRLLILQNAAQLIDVIKTTVATDSWANPDAENGGGGGTISFNLATMSLVIKQSAELHSVMRQSLFGR
jgi:hypothetical protein